MRKLLNKNLQWLVCSPIVVLLTLIVFGWVSSQAQAQQKKEISISRAQGLIYMVSNVCEKQELIEKHAAELGVPDLKVKWLTVTGGGTQTDALLSGSVDIVNSGIGNLLVLWDRTNGGIKGIIGTAGQPLLLITRNPNIKTLQDFGPADKIAVPTVKVSTHAVVLQMACAQTFGPDQWGKLDANTVQLGHPDAMASLSNPLSEVTSHFSAPPYSYFELKKIPGAHVVLSSSDVVGGPLAQAQYFTTTKFAEANPKVIAALKAATLEAIDFIHKDPRAAVEIYREISHDKTSTDELLASMQEPGMMDYVAAPHGTMKLAAHYFKTGVLKKMPKAWTDYYLPIIHDLPGD